MSHSRTSQGSSTRSRGHYPHLQGPLAHGRLDGYVLSCPSHGWQFDVTTGQNEFDRAITVERYEVAVEDGEVRVALPGP